MLKPFVVFVCLPGVLWATLLSSQHHGVYADDEVHQLLVDDDDYDGSAEPLVTTANGVLQGVQTTLGRYFRQVVDGAGDCVSVLLLLSHTDLVGKVECLFILQPPVVVAQQPISCTVSYSRHCVVE